MKKKLVAGFAFLIIIPIIIWLFSLIKCEILSHKHYNEFSDAYTQNTMVDEVKSFKVLSCKNDTAKVYYIEKNNTRAHVLQFEKQNNAWTETSWETVWSKTGSASGIVYPYWWHFIYTGF